MITEAPFKIATHEECEDPGNPSNSLDMHNGL